MNKTKTVLWMGSLLVMGLAAPGGYAQTYTFSTIAGGSRGSNNGVNFAAQFSTPTGVAVDNAGNVYVADQLNSAIREITPSGTNWIVSTIAGGTMGSRDGTNTDAQFSGPTGIAIDSMTNLYVADQFNYTIRKITPSGTNWVVTTLAGQVGVFGIQNGANTNAQFHNPFGIAVDTAGNLFVADEYNNAIREIMPDGGNWVVSTIAGQGPNSPGSQNGTNTAAQFSYPAGVAVDANSNVYVADQINNLIRLITPMGTNWVVTTIAGQLNAGFSNGLGTNAEFTSPVGVALDANSNLYVGDSANNAIREMMPTNMTWLVSTIGGGTMGSNNGTGTNAQFYLPYGVATDIYGDVFVADYENNAIRLGVTNAGAPPGGGLEVTLTPPNAVTAGAAWQLDGGPFQAGGVTLTGLTPGSHILAFTNVSGYTTPADQNVIITAHQTNMATGNYVLNGSLQVLISPAAAVAAGAQWQVDGGTFQTNGAIVADLPVGSHTLLFNNITGWVTPPAQTVEIASSQTTTNYGIYIIATNYTVTVSAAPAGEGTVSGGGTILTGTSNTVTAMANSGFEFIGWVGDVTGTESPLTVTVNTNLNITAYFAATGSTTVTVLTTGDGTVSPNLNGENLKAGRNYVLTAKAGNGYLFSNWTGSITTNKNPLTVKMESSLVLQANFVTNPFIAVKGTYNGLFTATNGVVTEQTAGMLKGLTIGVKGIYTGALLINGTSHAFNGMFDLAGQATNKISRAPSQGGPLLLQLSLLTSTNSSPQVTGMIYGTNNGVPWVATNLLADLATNTLPSAEFTMLLPPDTNSMPPTDSPGGYSYALITNYSATVKNPGAATTRITGALADGTAFNQTVPASEDGYVPVYANLYSGKGLLLGWINLNLTNTNAVTDLTWIHPTRGTGLYPNGFTNILLTNQILLSPWSNSSTVIGLLTNLSMVSTINNTNALTNLAITIDGTGKVTGTSVNGTINPRTGLFTVTIDSVSPKVTGHGAVLLNATNGGGYFLNGDSAQGIGVK